jgi:hypothetical protein
MINMSTFNYYREFQSGMNAPKANGAFWLYAKVDFAKQNMAAADVLKLFKIKDKWLLLRGFTRTLVASDGDATCDIGTTSGGQELDQAADQFAAGDWVTMSALTGTAAAIAITADGYIFLEDLEATCTSGIFEVMIEVYAGLDDAEGVGSLAA